MALATFLMKIFTTKTCGVLQGNTRGEAGSQCQYAESIQELDTSPHCENAHMAVTNKIYSKLLPIIVQNFLYWSIPF